LKQRCNSVVLSAVPICSHGKVNDPIVKEALVGWRRFAKLLNDFFRIANALVLSDTGGCDGKQERG
jgi:hypothetical protein